MALYEYRCRTCDERFEVRRPMAEANDPAPCPRGHTRTVRLLSSFASVSAGAAPAPAMAGGGGGGCCGGACGCGH
ncbi:FmdB family zinc ribbon protein [Desertimonas flava]|uniref:FmdB family zinc ribbon protein n=1 Tax=Desertimonas flava TaxID=2064846 RepID=UPI000E351CF4|nr:zinc ribbon domain-containing protein [Desertimonas flava]